MNVKTRGFRFAQENFPGNSGARDGSLFWGNPNPGAAGQPGELSGGESHAMGQLGFGNGGRGEGQEDLPLPAARGPCGGDPLAEGLIVQQVGFRGGKALIQRGFPEGGAGAAEPIHHGMMDTDTGVGWKGALAVPALGGPPETDEAALKKVRVPLKGGEQTSGHRGDERTVGEEKLFYHFRRLSGDHVPSSFLINEGLKVV